MSSLTRNVTGVLLSAVVLSLLLVHTTSEPIEDDSALLASNSTSFEEYEELESKEGLLPLEESTARSEEIVPGKGHGHNSLKKKIKKKNKNLKKILPFLLIPLLIQAKVIPLFLMKLKLLALKALMVGKIAVILIVINLIYNAIAGAHSANDQYHQEFTASEHYGYNGGPEYGAWVNRKHDQLSPYRAHITPS